MSNSDVELRAIELVIEFEKQRLKPTDVQEIKRMPKGCRYDLESYDGTRIEVKGSEGSSMNTGFRLNSSQEIKFAEEDGAVYRVLVVFGEPILHIINGKKLKLYKSGWASVSVPSGTEYETYKL